MSRFVSRRRSCPRVVPRPAAAACRNRRRRRQGHARQEQLGPRGRQGLRELPPEVFGRTCQAVGGQRARQGRRQLHGLPQGRARRRRCDHARGPRHRDGGLAEGLRALPHHEYEEQKGSVHAEAVSLNRREDPRPRPQRRRPGDGGRGLRAVPRVVVKVRGDGTLDPATWPNSGIGRINPDGSKGSCSSCHAGTASRRPRRASPRPACAVTSARTRPTRRSTRPRSTACCTPRSATR